MSGHEEQAEERLEELQHEIDEQRHALAEQEGTVSDEPRFIDSGSQDDEVEDNTIAPG